MFLLGVDRCSEDIDSFLDTVFLKCLPVPILLLWSYFFKTVQGNERNSNVFTNIYLNALRILDTYYIIGNNLAKYFRQFKTSFVHINEIPLFHTFIHLLVHKRRLPTRPNRLQLIFSSFHYLFVFRNFDFFPIEHAGSLGSGPVFVIRIFLHVHF